MLKDLVSYLGLTAISFFLASLYLQCDSNICQIITLYTLNLHNICQLHFSKARENLTKHMCTYKCVAYHSECLLLYMKKISSWTIELWILQSPWGLQGLISGKVATLKSGENASQFQQGKLGSLLGIGGEDGFGKRREPQTHISMFTSLYWRVHFQFAWKWGISLRWEHWLPRSNHFYAEKTPSPIAT